MEHNFTYYIFCLVALVVGFLVVKKITGCLIKTIFMGLLVAALAYVYYRYFRA